MNENYNQGCLRLTFEDNLQAEYVEILQPRCIDSFVKFPDLHTLEVDASACSSLDLKGICLLVALSREAQNRRLNFQVQGMSQELLPLLSSLHLMETLEIH